MNFRHKRIAKTVALLLAFLLTQIYLGLTFAAPGETTKRASTTAPPLTAILTTSGNKPITVNGGSATSGATILNGALIETPAGVSAKITIPGHGTLVLGPNSKVVLEYTPNGDIRVTFIQGCVVLEVKKGTHGEIDDAKGAMGKADGSSDQTITGCPGGVPSGFPGGGHGGLGTGATIGIIGGVAGGLALAFGLRSANSSNSAPTF